MPDSCGVSRGRKPEQSQARSGESEALLAAWLVARVLYGGFNTA